MPLEQPTSGSAPTTDPVDELEMIVPAESDFDGPVFSFDEPELSQTPRKLPRVTTASAEFEIEAEHEGDDYDDSNDVMTEEGFWSFARNRNIKPQVKRPARTAPEPEAVPLREAKRPVRPVRSPRPPRRNDLKMMDWPAFK